MYSVVGAVPSLDAAAMSGGAAHPAVQLGGHCWVLDRTSKPPRPVPYELLPGGEAPPSLAHRLLAPGSSGGGPWVLDGAAFVAEAEQLPAAHLRASLENCLLECTSTRLAQLSEQPSLSTTKVNTGTAALVQLVVGAGGSGAQPPALFPPSSGLPSLAELLAAAVLPPSATSRLLPQPAVQLFAAHCAAGVGRRAAAEQYDMGSMPTLYDRARSHARAAACRGGTFYTLLSGPPLWQCFHVQPGAGGSGGSSDAAAAAAATATSQPTGKAAGKKQPRQKRKQEAGAAAAAAAAVPAQAQPPAGRRPPFEPGTLVHSACSCCQPDLGVLWCSHRYDAMHALLSDPALHVLDCDALEALLAPLSQRQLAQLLLTVAFACGTLPDVLLSLQLPAGRQSALFLPRLASLSLAVPSTAQLRLCCHTSADATQAAYYGPDEPYMNTQRDAAGMCSNPLAAAHTASRLSVLSGAEGSALQGVEKRVRALSPELCWHLKGMGVDALDGYPESLSTANAAGIWPVDVRAGATLGFEDALGLTRALSLLGGSYTPIAQQLLKDLTVTVAHPHYCTAALPATAQPAFVRRLAAQWKQLTTPAERWSLFMEGGMRLPSVWSSVVLELAWEVVGQFPTMWAMYRQAVVMSRCTPRAAAMALLTRSTLLPRGGAAAGASAMTDLLLFERSMRRGFLEHLQGVVAFLKPRLASLRPPREGSLLQLAARSYGRQLMHAKLSLAQAHAAFQELILDLQEAVLAESARFLTTGCEREMAAPPPAPGTPEAAQPSDLRAAGSSLKGHTIGVLNTGHSFNANGLQRHALPAHLPPALTSSPFSWVTLDMGAMLADPLKEPDAPAWVCAYLSLAPKYSPAGAVALWAWMRAGGMLGRLLSAAYASVLRRDWHTAAMLCDAAHKYLTSSVSLAAAGAASETQQLTAARPMLRTLALAAAGQMRQCLALHRGGTVLTHTSSLRACCLLLRSVLSLTAELLDPALLQPHAAAAHAAVDALAAEIQGFGADAPPGGMPLPLQPGLAQMQQAMLDQVVAAHQHMHPAVQQAAQAEGLVPPPPPVLSPAAAAAAAVVGGGAGPAQQLALPAAEALAQDARMLVLVAQAVMDLASATIDAPALLPLASGSATAATSAVARRAMHDTGLWRAAEVSCELGQYPYEHNPVQDETHPRSFLLNDVALLLAQQLPVALLPLQQAALHTAAAAAGAAGPSSSNQQQQQQPGQPQAAQQSRGPETRSRAQRGQEAAKQASPAAASAAALAARQRLAGWQETALLGSLPLLDQLMGRLLDNFDGPPRSSRGDSAVASIRYRFKSSALLSLAVTLLRLVASSGEEGARQLAALPHAWKLLCSYIMEVAASSTGSSFHLRLFALAPPTLLSMLQACTVEGGEGRGGVAAAPAADAAAAGKEEGVEDEAQPPSKRRRRSSRQRGSDSAPSGRRSSTGGRRSPAEEAPSSAAADEAAAGTSAAAAAAVPAPAGQPAPARICVGGKALEIATVQRAVQRVLNWLSTGVQEHWRASSYTQWRPRAVVPPPQQQQQQGGGGGDGPAAPAAPVAGGAAAAAGQAGGAAGAAAAGAAAAGLQAAGQQQGGQPPPGIALDMNNAAQALAEAAMNGVAAFDMLAAANLEEQMMAAEAEAAEFGLPPHMLPPLPMLPHMPPHMLGVAAAVAAGLAGMAGALGAGGGEPPRPRRAFEPRSRTSAMAAALTSGWPASAVGVLHWWMRHRTLLQGPEFVTGPVGSETAAADGEEDTRAAAAAAIVGGQPDSRSSSFFTLDGPVVRLAHPHELPPKLGLLCGTLLSLLCMECAPEVHAAAAAALLGAAQQPATAQALAECGSFWALSRLLLRDDFPTSLKVLGGQVLACVKMTLLAQSGDWAAVFSTQQAAAADAEEIAAERRARAAEAVAARAADAPGGGGAGLQPPPEWFMQMGLLPGHLPPMMMGDEFDDFEDDEEDEEDEEDDMSEDEEGVFIDEDDGFGGMMGGAPPGFFF